MIGIHRGPVHVRIFPWKPAVAVRPEAQPLLWGAGLRREGFRQEKSQSTEKSARDGEVCPSRVGLLHLFLTDLLYPVPRGVVSLRV